KIHSSSPTLNPSQANSRTRRTTRRTPRRIFNSATSTPPQQSPPLPLRSLMKTAVKQPPLRDQNTRTPRKLPKNKRNKTLKKTRVLEDDFCLGWLLSTKILKHI